VTDGEEAGVAEFAVGAVHCRKQAAGVGRQEADGRKQATGGSLQEAEGRRQKQTARVLTTMHPKISFPYNFTRVLIRSALCPKLPLESFVCENVICFQAFI
jgi:hypothetical protein